MNRLSTLTDNAMLYKDMTQWLRNRTFGVLFFGLLVAAEVIVASIMAAPFNREGRAGTTAFSFLAVALGLYALAVAWNGYALTTREFANRTFELFELSGLSLEKMILGKLFSMLAQFFFGFFCLLPFLFMAYNLGGVDFFDIIAVAIIILLATLPAYLMALLLSLFPGAKWIRAVIIVGGFFFVPFVARWVLMLLAMAFAASSRGGGPSFTSPSEFLMLLMTLDIGAITGTFYFLLIYAQVCLMMFYSCCNAIAPSVDSRQVHLKLLTLTLVVTILPKFGVLPGLFLLLSVECIIGLMYFYGRATEPLMARNRRRDAKRAVTRGVQWLFAANSWGALRTVLCLCSLVAAQWLVVTWLTILLDGYHPGLFVGGHYSPSFDIPRFSEHLSIASAPLQMPFFLAVPAVFLLQIPRNRHRPVRLRVSVLAWWLVLGIPLAVATAINGDVIYNTGIAPLVLNIAGTFLSPISSMASAIKMQSFPGDVLPWVRLVLGFFGLALMWLTLRRREMFSEQDTRMLDLESDGKGLTAVLPYDPGEFSLADPVRKRKSRMNVAVDEPALIEGGEHA